MVSKKRTENSNTDINLLNKRCAVCGDQATGYHYNVLSCNGCEIFYRRSVTERRKFVCQKGGNCLFDKGSRCACRACRFRKCVDSGMKLHAIHSKRTHGVKRASAGFFSSIKPSFLHLEDQEIHYRAVRNLIHIENCCDFLRMSNYPITLKEDLGDLMTKPCALGEITKYQVLNDLRNPFPNKPPTHKWFEMDLCLFIEYAKSMDVYNNLNQADQRQLLRQAAGKVTILFQNFKAYEQKYNTIVFPDGSMPANDLRNRFATKQMYLGVPPLRRCDLQREHYVLLKAITFFTAPVDGFSKEGKQLIDEERQKLCLTLHNHLMKEHGINKGPAKFADILSLIEVYTRFAEIRKTNLIVLNLFGYIQFNMLMSQLIVD